MKNLINKSFSILKNNLIFIQPILIYLLILLIALQYLHSRSMGIYPKVLMGISVFLFAIVTISGLFYINKKALYEYNPEDDNIEIAQKSIKNFKKLFEGIGKYFLKIFSCSIIFICLSSIIIYLAGMYIYQKIGFPPLLQFAEEINKSQSIDEINSLIHSFKKHDIILINIWSLFIIIATSILKFLGILYISIVISDKKNIIISLIKTLTFFFKNFIQSIIIIVFMLALYLLVNFLTVVMGMNSFAFGLFLLLIAIYSNYYIILVLCFYNERTKTNSYNGTECNRQEQSCN